jgi:hypothetical protein
MAKKKTRMAGRRRATVPARDTGDFLRETWQATLGALSSAEGEMEKQVRHFMKARKISGKDARTMIKGLSGRVEVERKKAVKRLESRLKTLQSRVGKERKMVARTVNAAVKGTLATLNIPSRAEVTELSRNVAMLSRKIDSFKRRR